MRLIWKQNPSNCFDSLILNRNCVGENNFGLLACKDFKLQTVEQEKSLQLVYLVAESPAGHLDNGHY